VELQEVMRIVDVGLQPNLETETNVDTENEDRAGVYREL